MSTKFQVVCLKECKFGVHKLETYIIIVVININTYPIPTSMIWGLMIQLNSEVHTLLSLIKLLLSHGTYL